MINYARSLLPARLTVYLQLSFTELVSVCFLNRVFCTFGNTESRFYQGSKLRWSFTFYRCTFLQFSRAFSIPIQTTIFPFFVISFLLEIINYYPANKKRSGLNFSLTCRSFPLLTPPGYQYFLYIIFLYLGIGYFQLTWTCNPLMIYSNLPIILECLCFVLLRTILSLFH